MTIEKTKFTETDPETLALLQYAENLTMPEELGFADMGEFEGRDSFFRFMNDSQKGYRLPFASLHDDFLIAPNELTVISGYTGLGKTELVNHILLDCIAQGAKGVITSLELTANQLKKRLYQQSTGLSTATNSQQNEFHDFYGGKLKYWNGSKMKKIKELIESMEGHFIRFGCTVFVLDNMMMLGAKPSEYDKHYDTIDTIKNFCKNYPVSVFLVAHPRKPSEKVFVNFKKAEESSFDVPDIYEVSGSASIVNLCDNYLALGVNTIKSHTLKEIKAGRVDRRDCEFILRHGDAMLKRQKKREHGTLFNQELWFDCRYRSYKDSYTGRIEPYLNLKTA